MCWEIDYKFFADQKKAQELRIEQERRAGVIEKPTFVVARGMSAKGQ